MIASGLVRPVLSRSAVSSYLRHLHFDPDSTIFENVFTLPPAHFLEYKQGKIRIEKYWSLPSVSASLAFSDAVEQFRELMRRAVERQL